MSDSDPLSARQVAAETVALAEHLHRSGVQFFPRANAEVVASLRDRFEPAAATASPKEPASPSRPAATATKRSSSTPTSRPAMPRIDDSEPVVRYDGEALPRPERKTQLDQWAEKVAACTRCPELVQCRTQTVFGEGNPSPRVVFFGEGPGAEEDRSGRPFVGRAGQLLTKMIEACSFQRDDVYILNTVKCRPPNNRNPEPDEIENCREYYENQLSILRPEYIVCLGAISSRALLRSKLSVGRLRGKLHRYFESKVIVTYHPAYLLRTPAAKKAAWEDLQLMLRDAGIDPKSR